MTTRKHTGGFEVEQSAHNGTVQALGVVLNLRNRTAVARHPDAVRIDRRTRWGNRFRIGRDGDRAAVIEQYRIWLWQEVRAGRITLEDLGAVAGYTLLCHCAPLACHGDVLARAAVWAANQLRVRRAQTP